MRKKPPNEKLVMGAFSVIIDSIHDVAEQARDAALEEAAKVAEKWRTTQPELHDGDWRQKAIAQAIRELKDAD